MLPNDQDNRRSAAASGLIAGLGCLGSSTAFFSSRDIVRTVVA